MSSKLPSSHWDFNVSHLSFDAEKTKGALSDEHRSALVEKLALKIDQFVNTKYFKSHVQEAIGIDESKKGNAFDVEIYVNHGELKVRADSSKEWISLYPKTEGADKQEVDSASNALLEEAMRLWAALYAQKEEADGAATSTGAPTEPPSSTDPQDKDVGRRDRPQQPPAPWEEALKKADARAKRAEEDADDLAAAYEEVAGQADRLREELERLRSSQQRDTASIGTQTEDGAEESRRTTTATQTTSPHFSSPLPAGLPSREPNPLQPRVDALQRQLEEALARLEELHPPGSPMQTDVAVQVMDDLETAAGALTHLRQTHPQSSARPTPFRTKGPSHGGYPNGGRPDARPDARYTGSHRRDALPLPSRHSEPTRSEPLRRSPHGGYSVGGRPDARPDARYTGSHRRDALPLPSRHSGPTRSEPLRRSPHGGYPDGGRPNARPDARYTGPHRRVSELASRTGLTPMQLRNVQARWPHLEAMMRTLNPQSTIFSRFNQAPHMPSNPETSLALTARTPVSSMGMPNTGRPRLRINPAQMESAARRLIRSGILQRPHVPLNAPLSPVDLRALGSLMQNLGIDFLANQAPRHPSRSSPSHSAALVPTANTPRLRIHPDFQRAMQMAQTMRSFAPDFLQAATSEEALLMRLAEQEPFLVGEEVLPAEPARRIPSFDYEMDLPRRRMAITREQFAQGMRQMEQAGLLQIEGARNAQELESLSTRQIHRILKELSDRTSYQIKLRSAPFDRLLTDGSTAPSNQVRIRFAPDFLERFQEMMRSRRAQSAAEDALVPRHVGVVNSLAQRETRTPRSAAPVEQLSLDRFAQACEKMMQAYRAVEHMRRMRTSPAIHAVAQATIPALNAPSVPRALPLHTQPLMLPASSSLESNRAHVETLIEKGVVVVEDLTAPEARTQQITPQMLRDFIQYQRQLKGESLPKTPVAQSPRIRFTPTHERALIALQQAQAQLAQRPAAARPLEGRVMQAPTQEPLAARTMRMPLRSVMDLVAEGCQAQSALQTRTPQEPPRKISQSVTQLRQGIAQLAERGCLRLETPVPSSTNTASQALTVRGASQPVNASALSAHQVREFAKYVTELTGTKLPLRGRPAKATGESRVRLAPHVETALRTWANSFKEAIFEAAEASRAQAPIETSASSGALVPYDPNRFALVQRGETHLAHRSTALTPVETSINQLQGAKTKELSLKQLRQIVHSLMQRGLVELTPTSEQAASQAIVLHSKESMPRFSASQLYDFARQVGEMMGIEVKAPKTEVPEVQIRLTPFTEQALKLGRQARQVLALTDGEIGRSFELSPQAATNSLALPSSTNTRVRAFPVQKPAATQAHLPLAPMQPEMGSLTPSQKASCSSQPVSTTLARSLPPAHIKRKPNAVATLPPRTAQAVQNVQPLLRLDLSPAPQNALAAVPPGGEKVQFHSNAKPLPSGRAPAVKPSTATALATRKPAPALRVDPAKIASSLMTRVSPMPALKPAYDSVAMMKAINETLMRHMYGDAWDVIKKAQKRSPMPSFPMVDALGKPQARSLATRLALMPHEIALESALQTFMPSSTASLCRRDKQAVQLPLSGDRSVRALPSEVENLEQEARPQPSSERAPNGGRAQIAGGEGRPHIRMPFGLGELDVVEMQQQRREERRLVSQMAQLEEQRKEAMRRSGEMASMADVHRARMGGGFAVPRFSPLPSRQPQFATRFAKGLTNLVRKIPK